MSTTPLTDAALVDNADFFDCGTGKSDYVRADDMRKLELRFNELRGFCVMLLKRLDIEEESENERPFHPNRISSCRAIDGQMMEHALANIKRVCNEHA